MTCQVCGATIAEKAIVCYRCGTPTAQPASSGDTEARGGAGHRPSLGAVVWVLLGLAVFATGWILPAGEALSDELLMGAGIALVIVGGIRLMRPGRKPRSGARRN